MQAAVSVLGCLNVQVLSSRATHELLFCLFSQMEYGGECHISGRPYTKFRWRPGSDARYKSTIICQEVAKAKNVCQVRHGLLLPGCSCVKAAEACPA
jgi:hypothetical protein